MIKLPKNDSLIIFNNNNNIVHRFLITKISATFIDIGNSKYTHYKNI